MKKKKVNFFRNMNLGMNHVLPLQGSTIFICLEPTKRGNISKLRVGMGILVQIVFKVGKEKKKR